MEDYMVARRRPIGITLLSILFFAGGVLITTYMVYGAFFIQWDERAIGLNQVLDEMGIPLELLIGGIIFLAFLGLESGIEMWRGSKWGWYLGSFWYAYAISRNLNALWCVYRLSKVLPAEELPQESLDPILYYAKYGIRLAISLLIYNYFFKPNVRSYFGLAESSEWNAVFAEFAICIGILFATSYAATLFN
jgi:hypothetical protein